MQKKSKPKNYLSKNFIKYFLLVFIPLIISMCSITIFVEMNNKENELFIIKGNENGRMNSHTKLIASQFEMIITDLIILSENNSLHNFIKDNSIFRRTEIENLFLSFSKSKKLYDQIRFLDALGNEKVRVNFNNGTPSVVSTSLLQNKGSRYYFKNTIELSRGNVYISPFDLNVENGNIEQPLKPMIRFGIPVIDANYKKQGAIVINYLGSQFSKNLDSSSFINTETMLLNNNGFWLHSPNKEDEWGFMYEDKQNKKFQATFNSEWREIYNNESGQFTNENGLFTFTTIYPLREVYKYFRKTIDLDNVQDKYFWKLVSFFPEAKLEYQLSSNWNRILIIDSFVLFLILIISAFVARIMVQRHEGQKALEQSEMKLKKMNADKDKFFSIISHDLKSPFNGILGITEMLVSDYDELTSDEIKEMVQLLRNSSVNVYNLLEGLLEWSRTQIDRMEYEFKNIDISKNSKKVVELLNPNAIKKDITLETNIKENTFVFADSKAISTVIRNLTANAIKFTKAGGKVKIEVETRENELVISVSDNGIGMSEESKNKLFKIEVHHTTVGTNNETGTGVGLILCKELVEKHDGKIWVESEEGKGSTFYFTLKMVEANKRMY